MGSPPADEEPEDEADVLLDDEAETGFKIDIKPASNPGTPRAGGGCAAICKGKLAGADECPKRRSRVPHKAPHRRKSPPGCQSPMPHIEQEVQKCPRKYPCASAWAAGDEAQEGADPGGQEPPRGRSPWTLRARSRAGGLCLPRRGVPQAVAEVQGPGAGVLRRHAARVYDAWRRR